MTREEWAEFDAAQRDANLWRYFQGEEYRLGRGDDPDLRIMYKGKPIRAEEARVLIEEFYRHAVPV